MKKQFPYFNDSDIGYVDPDFLDENERQILLFTDKGNQIMIDEEINPINEKKPEELQSIS